MYSSRSIAKTAKPHRLYVGDENDNPYREKIKGGERVVAIRVVLDCMKEELELPSDTTAIYASEISYDGWLERIVGNKEMTEFRPGLLFDALEHLLKCKKCRKANAITLRKVKKIINMIEEEFRPEIPEETLEEEE